MWDCFLPSPFWSWNVQNKKTHKKNRFGLVVSFFPLLKLCISRSGINKNGMKKVLPRCSCLHRKKVDEIHMSENIFTFSDWKWLSRKLFCDYSCFDPIFEILGWSETSKCATNKRWKKNPEGRQTLSHWSKYTSVPERRPHVCCQLLYRRTWKKRSFKSDKSWVNKGQRRGSTHMIPVFLLFILSLSQFQI